MYDPRQGNGPQQQQVQYQQSLVPPPPQMQSIPQANHSQLVGMTSIPLNTAHTFVIKHVSQMDGKVWEGQFTCKKMSVKDLGRLGVRKAELNGGYYHSEKSPGIGIDAETDSVNSMISQLEISLVQYPYWFNLDNIYDAELLMAIYAEVAKFEGSFFRNKQTGNASVGSSPNDSSRASQESGITGYSSQVGGGEIPPSVDP